MSSSKLRQQRARLTRANAHVIERDWLEAIKQRLKRERPYVVFTAYEAGVLLRALDAKPAKVGAPATLAYFHQWIATHFLWLCPPGVKRSIAKAAYLTVRQEWGVSQASVEKFVRQHRAKANELLGVLGPTGIRQNIKVMAETFRALGSSET